MPNRNKMGAFRTCSHDFEIASKCQKYNILLLKISLLSIYLLSQYFEIFADIFFQRACHIQSEISSNQHFLFARQRHSLHTLVERIIFGLQRKDRGNDSYGSTLTPLGIVAPTFSQTKYDDNFTRLGRAAISQKQSHTKGFASSFADSLAHSLIKSILKSVRVCNFC